MGKLAAVFGRPEIEKVKGVVFRVRGTDNETYHGTNAWIYVFDLDSDSVEAISPTKITAKIRVSATDLIEHAFVNVPKSMLEWSKSDDGLLQRIRSRIQKALPAFQIE